MYTDKTLMPWGKKYKGKALANIPGSYFLWLWEESGNGKNIRDEELKAYIIDNMDAFKAESNKNLRR